MHVIPSSTGKMAGGQLPFRRSLGPLFVLLLLFIASTIAQDCSKDNPCATGCCSSSGYCGTTSEHCGDGCVANCDYKLGCDASNPCASGCCNKFGFCGLGPGYCGKDVCVAGCESKAYCDPGYGAEWAEKANCPLNVCCSKYGFCGITEEFCGNKTVKHETCSKDSYLSRVVGYYEGWSSRRGCNKIWPEQITMGVYSHINFAFATIDPETYEVLPADQRDVPLYKRLTDLKQYDPNLKIMIALGGWTFNDPGPTATVFSDLAASTEKQKKFFKSLISFMSTYDFDGVDLDWEYPEASDRNGRPEDFDNFPKFMANLKSALDKTPGRNEISITLPASYWYLQHFDIKKLVKHVSFFNMMTYDLHGTWDKGNKWTGEYLNAHTNLTEMRTAFDLLWRNDIKADKVVMGLAFYGRAYTVASSDCMEPGCLYLSGAKKGDCSDESGVLLNSEIVDIMATNQLSAKLYKDAAVKVTHWDDQWVSFDDKETLKIKTDFAREQCLGGVMVWAISHDTQNGTFSKALAEVSNRRVWAQQMLHYTDYILEMTNYDTCKWSNCMESCPSGWQMIKREDKWAGKDGYMLDTTACNGAGYRSWCCPPTKAPKCGWYSHNNGRCESGCPSGSVEIGSTTIACNHITIDYQSACCTVEDDEGNELTSMALYNTCEWADAPSCYSGVCSFKGSTKPTILAESSTGSGNAICDTGPYSYKGLSPPKQREKRKLCCNTEEYNRKWDDCQWHRDIGLKAVGQRCLSGCPADTVRVAMNTFNNNCYGSGGEAFCCNPVFYRQTERLSDNLQAFQDAVDAWIADFTCAAQKVLTTSMSARDEKCDREVLYMYVAQLLTQHIYNSDHWDALAKIWDRVGDKYPHLKAKSLLDFVTSDKYTPYYIHGKDRTVDKILDLPLSFDLMIGGDPNFVSCDVDMCIYIDCESDDFDESDEPGESEEGDAADELFFESDGISLLGKAEPLKYIWFTCKEGTRQIKLKYLPAEYPTVSQWSEDSDPMKEAVDFESKDECANCEVAMKHATKEDQQKTKYTTEHIVEKKKILSFLKWLMLNKEKCGVNCDFFSNWFFKAVLTGSNPPLLGGKNPQKPIQRLMEVLGSKNLVENFRLLEKSLNTIKGHMWGLNLATDEWKNELLNNANNPSAALGYVRSVIAIYNYMNLPEVWSRLQATNRLLREQMEYLSRMYNEANKENADKKELKLLECWDIFFAEFLKEMIADSTKFVETGIETIRETWKESDFPDDEDYVTIVKEANGFLDALAQQIGKITLDLTNLF